MYSPLDRTRLALSTKAAIQIISDTRARWLQVLYVAVLGRMTQQLEDVLSELRTKERELVLSARYGKALLEEKEQLRNELQTAREEMKQLEEVSRK